MANGDVKNLARRTAYAKALRYKAVNSANNPLYDRYHRGLVSVFNKNFDKTTSGTRVAMCTVTANRANITPSQQLADELHKGIIKTKRYI